MRPKAARGTFPPGGLEVLVTNTPEGSQTQPAGMGCRGSQAGERPPPPSHLGAPAVQVLVFPQPHSAHQTPLLGFGVLGLSWKYHQDPWGMLQFTFCSWVDATTPVTMPLNPLLV